MPFPFRLLCELLNRLDKNRTKSSNVEKIHELDASTVATWFDQNNDIIPRQGPDAIAFLSCLFPERRPDRVFGLGVRQLERIVGQAQCLGSSQMKELQKWETDVGVDFASCLERVMALTDCEPRCEPGIALEDLDDILDQTAATSPLSSAGLRERVRERCGRLRSADQLLSGVFQMLHSSEAKWMVRMLLKNYSPVTIPDSLAMAKFHFLLPELLTFQNSFPAAVRLLGGSNIRHVPIQPARDTYDELRESAVSGMAPQVGVMTARSTYEKARSVRHCCQLAGPRRMSVERKYDGEYCQIHVDLNRSRDCITIYSKSGRDSTNDRVALHLVLGDCLRLASADSKIKNQCILEGEVLVWNDDKGQIAPFHRIRSHVKRSGRSIGTARDSPANLSEHLMIMFYDILLQYWTTKSASGRATTNGVSCLNL